MNNITRSVEYALVNFNGDTAIMRNSSGVALLNWKHSVLLFGPWRLCAY